MNIEYFTFFFLLEIGSKAVPVEFKACDSNAAMADIFDAYGSEVNIITWSRY